MKESLIPYAKKQYNMAKLSFDLFGAVSPTAADPKKDDDLGMEKENGEKKEEEEKEEKNGGVTRTASVDRTISQTEVESSHEPVRTTCF